MSTHVTPHYSRHEFNENFASVPTTAAGTAHGKNVAFMASGFSMAAGQSTLCAEGAQLITFSGVASVSGFSGANVCLVPHSTTGQSIVGFSGYSDTSKE